MRASPFDLGMLLALAGACSRQAEIAGEPDGGLTPSGPVAITDAGLVPVDAGGNLAAGCAERPFGVGCRGANDFPCRFLPWVSEVAERCLERTGCATNGLFAAEMGAEGCVTGIFMSEPDEAFAECAAEELGQVRCECGAQRADEFLGIENDGCD